MGLVEQTDHYARFSCGELRAVIGDNSSWPPGVPVGQGERANCREALATKGAMA